MEANNEMIESDFLNIKYNFIEYYVGMAKMVVYWHVKALGFKVIAYAGPETGAEDKCSYLIVKNDIRLLITAASQPSSYKIVSFVDLHGNAIKRMGIQVENVHDFFERALQGGAIPIQPLSRISDEKGYVDYATVKLFDDNELAFVNYDHYNGDFMPGYKNVEDEWTFEGEDSMLQHIDHVACALRWNESIIWENYFNSIFQSNTVKLFDERQKNGEKKIGMLLKVLQSENKKMNNVLVEPDREIRSQIQLFIDQNYGAGIQHIAFSSGNIIRTVEVMRANGVRFTSYPDSYYEKLQEKYPELDVESFKKHGILCDVLDGALLLQIFTTPIGDRSTFFYEIVQRVNNYEGFGLDNIHALFEAMETELSTKESMK